MVNAPQNSEDPASVGLTITSHPAQIAEARRRVEQFCSRCGLSTAQVNDVGLCLNEALANVIRHAYRAEDAHPIQITAEGIRDAGKSTEAGAYPVTAVRVTIRDWGCGVNPAALPPKPRDVLKPGGVGLICLRSLMDEVTFTPQPDGMLLSMTKRRK